MTPRTVLFTLPADMTVGEVVTTHPSIRVSRIPIFDEFPDNVIGSVLKDDIYQEASCGEQGKTLLDLRRDLTMVSETIKLADLLERLLKNRQHAALVVDEHGGVAGIVTMEDVIETLLGIEIMDETDAVADMRTLARQQWLRRASSIGLTGGKEEDVRARSE
jgi:CBS domain containing-hemolysin-like protein